METELYVKLKGLIVDRLGVDAESVNPEASFTEDLGADSLDVVEFIMEMEDTFGLEIPDADAENLRTVGDAAAYLEANI